MSIESFSLCSTFYFKLYKKSLVISKAEYLRILELEEVSFYVTFKHAKPVLWNVHH